MGFIVVLVLPEGANSQHTHTHTHTHTRLRCSLLGDKHAQNLAAKNNH